MRISGKGGRVTCARSTPDGTVLGILQAEQQFKGLRLLQASRGSDEELKEALRQLDDQASQASEDQQGKASRRSSMLDSFMLGEKGGGVTLCDPFKLKVGYIVGYIKRVAQGRHHQ